MKVINMNKSTNNTIVLTTKTRIKSIATRDADVRGNMLKMVILNTDDGFFSGFMNVWKKQNIDIAALNEGDLLQIDYTEKVYAKNGKTYKNFRSVKVLPKPVLTNPTIEDDGISDDDMEEIFKSVGNVA